MFLSISSNFQHLWQHFPCGYSTDTLNAVCLNVYTSLCPQTCCFCLLLLCYLSSGHVKTQASCVSVPVLQLPRQSVLQQVLLSLFPMLLSTCHLLSSTASQHRSLSLLSLLWTAKELLITDLSLLCFSSSFLSHSNWKDNPQKYESARYDGHLALGTLAQRNCIEFEASLSYRVRLTLKKMLN